MTKVSETIPESLRPEVAAAVDWFNREQSIPFEVTGILDPDEALASESPRDLRLVLCGGDRCEQHSFRVATGTGGYDVGLLDAEPPAASSPQAEVDPPPGARREWLDRTLGQHAFTLILFYRGFW